MESILKDTFLSITDDEELIDYIIEHVPNEDNMSLYNIIADILNGVSSETIYNNIDNLKTGWKHPCCEEMNDIIHEQNEYITNPFEMEIKEGVVECKAIVKDTGRKCGSRRVISKVKQDRSCDEGSSTYSFCMTCGAKWRERG